MVLMQLYSFVLGLAVGSFLNVLILRTEKDEAVTGHSHCPHCKKTLAWYELVPVVSYLVQCGRCRSCKRRVSIQYPLVELSAGLLFVLVVSRYSFGSEGELAFTTLLTLGAELVAWSALITITVYDVRTKLIPDSFSMVFAVSSLCVGLLTLPMYGVDEVMWRLLAGPFLATPFALLWVVSRGKWLGLGDAKLAVGIGWLLGLSAGISAVMLAFWIGAVVGLLLVAYYKVRNTERGMLARAVTHLRGLFARDHALTMKSEVPFAPFLALGTLLAYAYSLNAWLLTDAIGRVVFPF